MTAMIVDMINRFVNYMSLNMPRFDIETGDMSKIIDSISGYISRGCEFYSSAWRYRCDNYDMSFGRGCKVCRFCCELGYPTCM